MEELQSWWEVPTIAHFCSLFRAAFSLLDFDIEELEEALLNEGSDEGNPFLTDLIIRLLSGCYQRTDLNAQNYQKYLKDFVKHHWSKEQEKENILENKDFSQLSLRHKVEILHALCDARLDSPDVADVLKNLEADSLRVEPLGRDESGSTYWYFYGTRLYKEAQISEIEIKNKEKEKLRKKKEKEKEKKRKRRERKKRRGKGKKGKDRKDKKDRRSSSSESDSDDESPSQLSKIPFTGWQVVCSTEEEWKELAERFKKSKNRNEKELFRTLTVDFLPEIGRMIIEREKQQKKKSIEFTPRRSSQRIERLRQQREEEERLVAITLVEEQKRFFNDSSIKTETDKERREREARQREERLLERQIAREERARRVQLREERARLLAEGKELPPHLQNTTYPSKNKTNCNVFTESEEDIYVDMYKVFEILKNHRDAWPFAQPVDEEYAPGYYDIVKQPMDLSTIEKNLQQKIYCRKEEFENDVMLMLDNCRKYNGIDSDYTKMSKNLQFAFEKAMQRFFPPDSSDDDFSGSEELEIEKPTVGSQITKPLNVKGIEVLARVAEQALQNSSQRSKPYTLTIANVHPASFSNASVARSIENSSQTKTNVSLCMINVPSDRNSIAGTDNSSNQSKSGIKQRFQQILYSSGKEINKDSTGKKLSTTVQDKKAKISGSLDAMSKMVDGLPEKQKRSILNFTAIYQASLIARTENKNENAVDSNSEVKIEPAADDSADNIGNKIVPAPSNSELVALSGAETLTCFEPKGELLIESKIKTEDKFNSKMEVQSNNNQSGTKNIVILNSSAFSNTNIPVNSNILVLHNAIPVSAISTSNSDVSDKNNTAVSNSPVVYCQLATGTTTTSSVIPSLTVATSDSGNNLISAASSVTDKSLNLPNNAIPVKKRAYLSVETNSANTMVPSSNGFKKDVDSNKRKLEGDEKGDSAPLMKLPKSENADKNGTGLKHKNGLQPQHLLNLNSVVVNANSSKEKTLSDVVNCGKTSVITSHSSVTKSSSPLIKMVNSNSELVEGLAGKLQQQQSCPSLSQETDANKRASDSSVVKATIPISTNNILKGYVHLPRGVSPAAENFAQKLTMDVSGNVSNNCVRLGTQIRNKTTVLMNASIPNPNNSSHQQTLRLQPKIATTQNSVNHVVNNVMIANYTSPQTTTIAVQPQQPPVQYSICIGQNRISTSSSGGTTAYHNPSAVPISSQSHCEKLTTTPIHSTHIQLNSGLNDSKQTIISPQLQYVDQSGIRYTALPANLVPLTVRTEQAQPQQVFYVQQQGQMVIQPQLLTQHYQPTSHNVTSQTGFGSPKTIITMPAVPQQTFLATQPQSLSTPVHNGTSTHYYTVLPHHPMT